MPSDNSYTIKTISSVVTINEDSTVDFTETITVDFHSPHLGIYRDLATNSGERYRNIEIIRSDWYEIGHEDGFLRISLGLPDGASRVTGEQTYSYSYTMILPERGDYTDIYLNLIGFGFTTDILKADVTLYSPAQLSDMKFFTRYASSSQSDEVSAVYEGEENGSHKYAISAVSLPPFNGITMRADIPEGVIADYPEPFPIAELVACVLLAAAGIVLLLTAKNGQEVTEITNYYPPEDTDGTEMTPADVGLYIDGTLSAQDITSMIFYWASKGYIEIEDAQSKNPLLVKKREMSADEAGGAKYLHLFDRIFSAGDEVRVDSLQYKLASSFRSIVNEASKKTGKFYDKKASFLSAAVMIASIVVVVAIAAVKAFIDVRTADIIPNYILFALAIVAGYSGLSLLWKYGYKLKNYKACCIAAGLAAIAVATAASLLPALLTPDVMTLPRALLAGAGAAFAACSAAFFRRRTSSYRKILGEVAGFKNFLEVAEKDRLEMLLEENPQYYYDILPYAHVLGVSDKWEDKFKDIALEPPRYVSGGETAVNLYLYTRLMHSMDAGMRSAMSHKPSSSSRSGFGGFRGGGGGFGGGGFGGGGGGAR